MRFSKLISKNKKVFKAIRRNWNLFQIFQRNWQLIENAQLRWSLNGGKICIDLMGMNFVPFVPFGPFVQEGNLTGSLSQKEVSLYSYKVIFTLILIQKYLVEVQLFACLQWFCNFESSCQVFNSVASVSTMKIYNFISITLYLIS